MASRNQLKSLLKKKHWTGTEVGKLLITSMLNDIKQQKQGKENVEPLFSQEEFELLENGISGDKDYVSYGVYRDLYRSIIDSYNRGLGLYQQFYNGFSRLLSELSETIHADEAQKSYDKIPLIMTESQYNRRKIEAVKILSGYEESFGSLVFYCLEKFMDQDESYTKEEAPEIWKALESAKKIPATGNRFLPSYNDFRENGYYTLPDGRRSDQMTMEEWQNALREEFLKTHKLLQNGEPATIEETVKHYNVNRLLKCYELFFKGAPAVREELLKRSKSLDITDEELEEAIKDIIDSLGESNFNQNAKQISETLGFATPTEWHYYDNPPEGLTLYDLLDLYSDEAGELWENTKEALKYFKEDAPDLYLSIKTYIENKVPQAKGLRSNQLCKDIVTWGDLAEIGFLDYRERIQPTDFQIVDLSLDMGNSTANMRERRRALNGIAILKNPSESQIDEQGDYTEKENPLSFFQTLYSLENDKNIISDVGDYIDELISPALSYLYAFNALMRIIGEVYDLPDLAEVSVFDTSLFESKIYSYNNMLYYFHYNVYGSEAEKQRKRKIIKKIFRPIDSESLKPSKEAIEELTEELGNLGISREARKNLKYLDAFIDRLMYSGEGAL